MNQPLAALPYANIQWIWWVFQQLAFLSILFLVYSFFRPGVIGTGIIFATGALASLWPSWQLHLVQGQIYIVYALWITIGLNLYRSKARLRVPMIALWLVIGLLMRPTLLVFGLPFLYLLPVRKWPFAALWALGLLILGMLISGGFEAWTQYREALDWYTREAFGTLPATGYLAPAISGPEGMQNLTHHLPFPIMYFSSLKYYTGQLGWSFLQPVHFTIFFFGITAFVGWLTHKKWASYTAVQWLALASLVYFFSEISYFFRMPYNQVQWLPMVAAGLVYLANKYKNE